MASRPTNHGTRECPSCGSPLPDWMTRCPVCGTRLSIASTPWGWYGYTQNDRQRTVRVLTDLHPTREEAERALFGYTWSEEATA